MPDGKKTGLKRKNPEPEKTEPDKFATPTLAKLYVQQGRYDRAMAIYHRLEDEGMAGPEVKKAIERLSAVRTSVDAKKEQDLANLFLEWISLVKRHRYLTAS